MHLQARPVRPHASHLHRSQCSSFHLSSAAYTYSGYIPKDHKSIRSMSNWRSTNLPIKPSANAAAALTNTTGSVVAADAIRQQTYCSDNLGPGETFDVVVVGSGIGGLSCAAMLAYYGFKVAVVESHSAPGGAAHCWTRKGCHFDSGTALFFGLLATPATQPKLQTYATGIPASQDNAALAAGRGAATACSIAGNVGSSAVSPSAVHGSSDNPLAAVLELLDEPLDLIPYGPDRTCLVFSEGSFNAQIGSNLFPDVVEHLWGSAAKQEWLQLQQLCRDLAAAAVALHPMVVRYDPLIALTAGARRPGRFLHLLLSKPKLLQDNVMFSELVDSVVSCPALKAFIDVLCQGTSGATAAAIPAAYMVRAFTEMYQPGTQLQWPRGGPQAIADALVRGLRKHGGKLQLNCHVASILQGPGGRAAGVTLKDGSVIKARTAVVSNASIWDSQKLVPADAMLPEFKWQVAQTVASDSFVHLHAVVNVPPDVDPMQLPVHSYFLAPQLVGDTGWPTLTIATAVDDTLAPPGKQILHAYMAEPYAPWQHLTRGSTEYKQLKQQKSEQLWGLIDQVTPWARQQLDWQMVGTPLTHQHFRRRHLGAYGPRKTSHGNSSSSAQPEAVQPMKSMYCCGDSTYPYIGTPAVAASGAWVANTLAPVWKHWAALNIVDR